jgi:hypothetical protein
MMMFRINELMFPKTPKHYNTSCQDLLNGGKEGIQQTSETNIMYFTTVIFQAPW